MLFNSFEYAIFLPAVWCVFWLVPGSRRVEVLLLAVAQKAPAVWEANH